MRSSWLSTHCKHLFTGECSKRNGVYIEYISYSTYIKHYYGCYSAIMLKRRGKDTLFS